jgi:hypothetical protein
LQEISYLRGSNKNFSLTLLFRAVPHPHCHCDKRRRQLVNPLFNTNLATVATARHVKRMVCHWVLWAPLKGERHKEALLILIDNFFEEDSSPKMLGELLANNGLRQKSAIAPSKDY